MKVVLDHKEKISHNVTTFWWRSKEKVRYTAGQFIELHLPHTDADERGEKHWFTLSSSPTEELLSITTKYDDKRSSTFKKTLFSLASGTEVNMAEPMGDFVLPKDKNIPLVFVAGGIGVTPFRSMLKWLVDTKEKRTIEFIYAVSETADAVFADLFRGYGVEPKMVISGEGQKLTGQKILDFTPNFMNKRIYVSGPEPMVEDLEKQLLMLGVAKHNLVLDFFPGYVPL